MSWSKSSLHIQSSPLRVTFHQFQETTTFIWITIAFYKGFVLELLIFKSYFYTNKSFLKEKTVFENGLLRHGSLGINHGTLPFFTFGTFCTTLDQPGVGVIKLCQQQIILLSFFSSNSSSKAHVITNLICWWYELFSFCDCVNWKVWGENFRCLLEICLYFIILYH